MDVFGLTLGKESFKILSSSTRLKILKLINKKKMNVTDIASELSISKSTAHEHLKKLITSNLVKRSKASPKAKWVFYELTEQGESLFKSELRKISILLGLYLVGVFGGFTYLLGELSVKVTTIASSIPERVTAEAPKLQQVVEENATEKIKDIPVSEVLPDKLTYMSINLYVLGTVLAILLILTILVLAYFFVIRKKKLDIKKKHNIRKNKHN